MAKDPAFLFYPGDWLGGTMGMSLTQKGAYFHLLMVQFNNGHMTEDMIRHEVGHIWDKIKHKFLKDEDGLWYNKRLKDEKEKRIKYAESRKNNKNGKNQHKKNGHMTYHMENENYNNKNGVNFNEEKTIVFFADGTKQNLGKLQQMEAKTQPASYFQKGITY